MDFKKRSASTKYENEKDGKIFMTLYSKYVGVRQYLRNMVIVLTTLL